MIMSPGSMYSHSLSIVESTGAPACTRMITRLHVWSRVHACVCARARVSHDTCVLAAESKRGRMCLAESTCVRLSRPNAIHTRTHTHTHARTHARTHTPPTWAWPGWPQSLSCPCSHAACRPGLRARTEHMSVVVLVRARSQSVPCQPAEARACAPCTRAAAAALLAAVQPAALHTPQATSWCRALL
jgi:hypothetical protein